MTKRLPLFMMLSAWSLFSTPAMADTKLEAEDAESANCEQIEDSKYSGGKALALKANDAKITFTYHADEGGKYTVYVGCDGPWGDKVVRLTVNGSATDFQSTTEQTEVEVGTMIFNEGDNTLVITPSWTWFVIDYIRIDNGSNNTVAFDIAQTPVDADATDAAKEMYTFLYDNFGQKTISGIMTGDMSSANGDVTQHDDVQAVYKASGKYPALVGFDFMNATGKEGDVNSWYKDYTDKSIALAKDLYRRGGLPAFTWHWRDPSRATNDFYCTVDNKPACTMKISEALNADGSWNTESELYANMVKDIDVIADHFLTLQEEGIACIFRPLHEASGAWFWWGADGAANCVKLYQLVRDEMVNVKGVHNLIWVWNPEYATDEDWNPGSDIYDVISIDKYNKDGDYSTNYADFDKLRSMSEGKKIIALSENGPIPDIDKEFDEDAVWSWWMPWYQTWGGNFVDQTSNEEWAKCMNDERVITLEDRAEGWGATAIQTVIAPETSRPGIYDLQGRRLTETPTKGIYIKDGRKMVIK